MFVLDLFYLDFYVEHKVKTRTTNETDIQPFTGGRVSDDVSFHLLSAI